MATYRRITVSVPETPVSEPLPDAMTFYVDTRFTTAQVSRIRSLIVQALNQWRTHFEQLDERGISNYQVCVNRYARFNLSPVWFDERLANGAAAAAVQMDGFTTMITANGFNRASKAYIMYEIPRSGEKLTIRGVNGSDPERNSLTVTINPRILDNTSVTNLIFTGALIHAWFHREGYRHPAGRYTGYFAGEAAMCVMRGNQSKVPGQPDGVYTQYLM